MPGSIRRQTVVLLDAPLVTGDYNTLDRDWDNAAETSVDGCTVDYTSSSERREAREQTVTTAELLMPRRASTVTSAQRVRWDGRTWEVHGDPDPVEAAGRLSGQVVQLREVSG
ncbi:hypothetical protein [Streptomyces sp. NPDC047097]|uniref:phage head completion protein n=1 Tax=Streptomyces sp. NPDC047097 TaxID=3155260 RepID=UPI0033EDFD32